MAVNNLALALILLLCSSSQPCEHPDVRDADKADKLLRAYFRHDVIGQHIAESIIPDEIYSHLSQSTPARPLVLSLHGWTGTGKTFAARQIMQALYADGDRSEFVKFYNFANVDEYKKDLINSVIETVEKCARSLFIFDEVDKLPEGLLDTLVPLLVDPGPKYKNAIFLLVGNAGGNDTSNAVLDSPKSREHLIVKDFEHILSSEAFRNGHGSWYQSEIIRRRLVTRFVPFLPLEKGHVLECFRTETKQYPEVVLEETDFEIEAQRILYWPEGTQLFSWNGCRPVKNLVAQLVQKKLEEETELKEKRRQLNQAN